MLAAAAACGFLAAVLYFILRQEADMERERNCKARRYSDQMICNKCGLVWDVNDQEPPKCEREQQARRMTDKVAGEHLRRARDIIR